MENTSCKFNSKVAWNRLLNALNVKTPRGLLPCFVECPLCHKQNFNVYRDIVCGGEWYFCQDCRWGGDSIELAAKVWDVDLATALVKLDIAETSASLPAKRYLDIIDVRRQLFNIWKTGRENHPFDDKADIRNILHKFAIQVTLDRERWMSRMGNVIGSVNVSAFKDLGYTHGGHTPAIAFTHSWNNVIVIPYTDLPGRVTGFLCIGRKANEEAGDFVFKKILLNKYGPTYDHGLGLFNILYENPINIDDSIFIVEEPIVGLKMHSNHFMDNERPIPLLISYHDIPETKTIWKFISLLPRKIFWGPRVHANRILRQAKNADGDVAPFFDKDVFLRKISRRPPTEWLTNVKNKSQHWRYALEEYIKDLPINDMQRTFGYLGFSNEDLHQFAKECQPPLDQKLEKIRYRLGSTVKANNTNVAESDGKWIIAETGEVISDAILRIDKAVYRDDMTNKRDKVVYIGRIIYKGDEIPFESIAYKMEESPFIWMRRELIRQGKGFMEFNPRWSNQGVNIAIKFHEPVCEKVEPPGKKRAK